MLLLLGIGNGLFDINAQALTNPVRRFIGTGTLHEMGSGLERLVIPDLGAAGPVLTSLQGTHTLKFTKGNYSGSGTLLNTASANTAEFNVYPWSATGSLTLSGTTTTPYQDAYIPIIKNSAKVKGRGVDYLIKSYARPIDAKFDLEDNGFVTSTFGGKFSDSDDLTFDRIKTKLKDRSFSDSDQLTSEDFGLLSVTTRVITVDTPTVLDAPTLATATYDYNASDVFVASNGTGSGSTGGFAIGDHFKFGSDGGERYFWWRFNTEYSDSIKFKVIRGNWSNGGERPDNTSESLYLDRWTGSAWVSVATVGAWDDDNLDQLTEVEVPLSASNKGYYFYRLRQPNASNSFSFDHWGVSSIEYSVRTTPTVPIENEDRGVLERKLGGGLFLHQYQATGVGAQESFPICIRGYWKSLQVCCLRKAPEFGFAYSGSGTTTFSGTNFFSQAPQSTVFGVGDKLTVSGAATESFTPATVDNAVLFNQTGSSNESIVSRLENANLLSDLLDLYLTSVLLLVVEINPILYCLISLVDTPIYSLLRVKRIQISSTSVEDCYLIELYSFLLGYLQLEILQQRNTIGVSLLLFLQLKYRKILADRHKRRDNTEGCRELGIPSWRVQLRSTGWTTLSKYRFSIRRRYFTCCSNRWNSWYPYHSSFRRCFCCRSIRLRVFGYHWYCYLQGLGINIFGANWFSQSSSTHSIW